MNTHQIIKKLRKKSKYQSTDHPIPIWVPEGSVPKKIGLKKVIKEKIDERNQKEQC